MRVYYVSRESLYASWNRGINLAKGDVLGFWNVDDVRYPEAVIDAIDLINKGAELVYFPFMIKWHINLFGFSLLVKRKRVKPPVFDKKKISDDDVYGD